MPELKTGSSIIKRKLSVKFLGVMFDENMPWKNDAKMTEKKNQQKILVYYMVLNHFFMKHP